MLHSLSIGNAWFTCLLLVNPLANARSHSASGVTGSTSIRVSLLSENQVGCESLRLLGFVINSTVEDGVQLELEAAVMFHKESEASPVLSNTFTRVRSVSGLSFFRTACCQLKVSSLF